MEELIEIQADPNSTIHFSYFSKSAAETDLAIFLRANSKSPLVTGIWSSSLESARISSGLKPLMRRLIAIKDASLKMYQSQWILIVANATNTFSCNKVKRKHSKNHVIRFYDAVWNFLPQRHPGSSQKVKTEWKGLKHKMYCSWTLKVHIGLR